MYDELLYYLINILFFMYQYTNKFLYNHVLFLTIIIKICKHH